MAVMQTGSKVVEKLCQGSHYFLLLTQLLVRALRKSTDGYFMFTKLILRLLKFDNKNLIILAIIDPK